MAQVLLTVSGTVAPDLAQQVAADTRPRADYHELARAFNADIIDYAEAQRTNGWLGRLVERVAGRDGALAWACFKRRNSYRLIFTDGEQVGLPLAALLKFATFGTRPQHHMIVHILSVKKKQLLLDLLGLQSHIDLFLVYATWQQRFVQQRWHLPVERVVFTPFMVDQHFFRADHPAVHAPTTTGTPLISTAGLEARDYPTLIAAVAGLDVRVTVAAASPWSKREDNSGAVTIPDNVTVQRFSQYELRQVYADSRFVVMPLQNVDFQAGVTAILEAMAMERAVICTRTPGQTDVVVDNETGIYVPPGDVQALRDAISYLLDHPEEAARMGKAGRQRIEGIMSLDHYVARLARHVHTALRPSMPTERDAPMHEREA